MESVKKSFENYVIECSKCGNKYGITDIHKELRIESIFQFEYEFKCKNCDNNEFSIQFEYIPEDY